MGVKSLIQWVIVVFSGGSIALCLAAAEPAEPATTREPVASQAKPAHAPSRHSAANEQSNVTNGTAGSQSHSDTHRSRPRPAPPMAEAKAGQNSKPHGAPSREQIQKFRQELRKLSPEEREKQIQAFRKRWGKPPYSFWSMTSAEWKAKRVEIKERLEKRVQSLRQKKKDGALTEPEQKRLGRMEELLNRFQENASVNVPPPILGVQPQEHPPDK